MTDMPQVLLAHHLKALKLPTFLREYDKLARQCATEGVDHPRYLLRLAELELIDRERRTVERRIKEARFPAVKSLDSFDFAAIPSLNKTLVLELARSEYVTRRENIIALGNTRYSSLVQLSGGRSLRDAAAGRNGEAGNWRGRAADLQRPFRALAGAQANHQRSAILRPSHSQFGAIWPWASFFDWASTKLLKTSRMTPPLS